MTTLSLRRRSSRLLLWAGVVVGLLMPLLASAQETVLSTGANWRWRKGTNEVSSPNTQWRDPSFNVNAWPQAAAPFHYGEGIVTGTSLTDMRSNYTCVFLRSTFVVTNLAEVSAAQFVATCDDGFIAWINGVEVVRDNVSVPAPLYTSVAIAAREAEPAITHYITLPPTNYLVAGTNVLAVQSFNNTLGGSSDFRFDTSVQLFRLIPPVITSVAPPAGSTVGALTQVTVTFDKPLVGVDASDLLVNGQPAAGLVGGAGTNVFVFTFTQPLAGDVAMRWDELHGITSVTGAPFDADAAGSIWNYTLTDTLAPVMSERTPVPGAQVGQLTQVEVSFSEPVVGVDAADLLVNGVIATSVSGSGAGPYLFQFPPPSDGVVQFAWAGAHGIMDTAAPANAFSGGNWSVTFTSGLAAGDVIINEFLAGNTTGIIDENGEQQDWIEIYNRGTNAVNLLGWSLTDDAQAPGRWVFPATNLAPGQFLVVYASGKDRRTPGPGQRFHTNFKLEPFGEYLALFNAESPRVAVSEFAPKFPEQRNNYSYGRDSDGAWWYYSAPSPGGPNGVSSISAIAPQPHFSVERGIFDQPFNLLLTTPLAGAVIRYTTDGSEPTASTGIVYAGPIAIDSTRTIRAAVFCTDYLPSRTRTHSYIFPEQVLTQPNNPAGFPSNWGPRGGFGFPDNLVPADYEMDLDPVRVDPLNPASPLDPAKLQRLREGLRELPIVSIVMKTEDMFGATGIYHSANVMNKTYADKPCSIEMILPDGSTAFAETCGIRIHGNASREPEKNPKHGFKLKFNTEFGAGSLKYLLFPDSPVAEYDDLLLRADFGVSWRHWSDAMGEINGSMQRTRAVRFRDAWLKESARDLGVPASRNRFSHLFINGIYWGTYDFSEQPKALWAAGLYGGTKEDYDVYEQGSATAGYVEGTLPGGTVATYNVYQKMLALPAATSAPSYDAFKQHLDVTSYIDYTLLHFFVGHRDWGTEKNWYAVRQRAGGTFANEGTFKFVPWDGECGLLNADNSDNRIPDSGGGNSNNSQTTAGGLHAKLKGSAQYRLDFADRVHRHIVAPDGALTAGANIARWLKWSNVLDKAIVAESARWGDYRRDVHPYANGTYSLYTREDQWLVENARIVGDYLPNRRASVLGWLRTAGLYPAIDAPEFRAGSISGPIVGGGRVGAGYVLAMRNPGAGTIHYTTNGADPRVYHLGTVADAAQVYAGPLTLNASATIKARVLNGTNWSALNEAAFIIGEPGVPLAITELMYNPPGGNAYEFIELQNLGALPLDLGGFSFQGITYIIPAGTVLAPGATLLLANAANPAQFATRYPGVAVFDYFTGSLDNAGERIAILDGAGRTVLAVHYEDEAGWPTSPDGGGYSLEIIDPRGDLISPANWRASVSVNGTAGLPPVTPAAPVVVLNEVAADNTGSVTNSGSFPDWIELYNRGAAPVSLANWSLTDSGNARKFVFPGGTSIATGGHLVVWCDGATNAPGLHTGFALGQNGENISLYDASTNRADAVSFGRQISNLTLGRVGDQWTLTHPTPGAVNAAVALASPTNVAVNEWLADSPPGSEDWIELFNRSSNAPVALRGLHLATSNALFQIRTPAFLAPRGFIQLFADELPGPDHLEFKLSASGGAIALLDASGLELERVSYGAQTQALTEGRLPDGAANFTTFPGSASPAAANYLITWTGPVLNEILARNDRAELAPWGRYADWIELRNPSNGVVSLDGLALGRGLGVSDRWAFPSGVTIPANGFLRVWCDGDRAASMSAGAGLNTGFSLPGEGGDVYLFNAAGQPVDAVSYGFQVQDMTIGRSGGEWKLLATPTPGAVNATAAALGSASSLRVNEWMAAPPSGDDWFELFNTSALPVALDGLFLTDNPSSQGMTQFAIAPLSFIGGGRWVKWEASGSAGQGRNHVNFSLGQQGETIRLYGVNTNLVDAIDFGFQSADVSQGRLPDGAANVAGFPETPTPGAANYVPLTSVVINEVLAHTDAPLEDAIELHNPTAGPVDIGGWYLSDSQGDLKRYRIPDGTVIPAGGFKVFYQAQFGPADGEADVPPLFSFNSAYGDSAYLSAADAGDNLTGHRAEVSFGASANGVSLGRHLTSLGVEFVALSARTFGVDDPASLAAFRTSAGAVNAYPLVGPVVINEIMFHPLTETGVLASGEFIELQNVTGAPVPLYDPAHPTNVWRLANAVTFDFPTGTVVPAGGRLLVVPFDPATDAAQLAEFQSLYGTNGTVMGPYVGRLDNAGETIELWRPDTPQADAGYVPQILVERVAYLPTAPWPVSASGTGNSSQRILAANFGNDPVNWRVGLPTVGAANTVPPVGIAAAPGNGTVRLTFSVQAGVTYQLEFKHVLTDAEWQPLGSPVVATGDALVFEEATTGQPQRFYRLSIIN